MPINFDTERFKIYPLNEVTHPAPASAGDLAACIPAILAHHLPGKNAARILDRGEWGRRVFEVTLDSGEVVLVKFIIHEDWFYSARKTRILSAMYRAHGLCAVQEIAWDDTKTLAPLVFSIEKKAPGVRLDRLLKTIPEEDRRSLYQAIGEHYRVLHSIPGPRAGYWLDDPDRPFPDHPSEHYLQTDMGGENGAGRHLVSLGCLFSKTLERVLSTWRSHMDELKDHPVVLVHGNATPWCIYLEKTSPEGGYRVSRMGVDECVWWDAAYDLAILRWPPLSGARPEDWQALVDAYGSIPSERRFLFYRLLQGLITASWAYMGPRTPESDVWLADFRQNLESNLNTWIDQLDP